MTDRIKYPDTWPSAAREQLDAMFATAMRDGLWFFHGGMSGPLWFSPDQLQAEQDNGSFVWGAANWVLRDPQEQLQEANRKIADATADRDRIARAIGAA